MKTAQGLVRYVKAMVGHPFWYGCYGQIATRELYEEKKKQYPLQYLWRMPEQDIGQRVFDCVGLIKGYLWSNSEKENPVYRAWQDVSANGMLAVCEKRGSMEAMPNVPGLLLFHPGHAAVYIGGGRIVEARGHRWGVVETKLYDRAFTEWGFCPWINY